MVDKNSSDSSHRILSSDVDLKKDKRKIGGKYHENADCGL